MVRLAILTLIAALAAPTPAPALDVGDTAPELSAVTWVKGRAPNRAKQVTVVEFWATWCAPCKESHPHLSWLQQRYGDAIHVVGLSQEDLDLIEPYVAQAGDNMAFAVGRLSPQLHMGWLEARAQIPQTFIVDTAGVVRWKGHPMTMDQPLAMVLADELDVPTAKALVRGETALNRAFQARDPSVLRGAARDLLAVMPTHQRALYVFAGISRQAGDLAGYREWFAALDPDALDAEGAALIADLLLTSEDPDYRLLDVAVPLAERAVAADAKSPAAQDAAASARYLLGDLGGAIAHAERAAGLAPDDENLAARLAYYRLAADLATR